MSAPAVEAFLARLYTEPQLRAHFLADRRGEAERAGLTPDECEAMAAIDGDDLELAAASFARKRGSAHRHGGH